MEICKYKYFIFPLVVLILAFCLPTVASYLKCGHAKKHHTAQRSNGIAPLYRFGTHRNPTYNNFDFIHNILHNNIHLNWPTKKPKILRIYDKTKPTIRKNSWPYKKHNTWLKPKKNKENCLIIYNILTNYKMCTTTPQKPTKTTPNPTTPKRTTTTPRPTTQKPTTTTPRRTTTTRKPIITTPRRTTTTRKPITTTPKPTSTTPKPTTTTRTTKPEPTTPKPTTTRSKPTTSTPKSTTNNGTQLCTTCQAISTGSHYFYNITNHHHYYNYHHHHFYGQQQTTEKAIKELIDIVTDKPDIGIDLRDSFDNDPFKSVFNGPRNTEKGKKELTNIVTDKPDIRIDNGNSSDNNNVLKPKKDDEWMNGVNLN